MPSLTLPPISPDPSDPSTYAKRTDDHIAWRKLNTEELNVALPAIDTKQVQAIAAAETATTKAGEVVTKANEVAASAAIATAAAASAVNAPGTSSLSTTSLALTPGTKNLAVAANKDFPHGSSVKIAYNTDVSKWMIGSVDSYNATTGAMVVVVDANDIKGTGTFADWTVSVSGHRGAPGVAAVPPLPIGAVAAFHGQTTNPVILADGSTWLRSGTIALSSTYPNAVKNMAAESGGDLGTTSTPLFYLNGLWVSCTATFIATSPDLKTWTRHYHTMGQSPTCAAYDGVNYIFTIGTKAYRTTDFTSFVFYMTLPKSFSFIRKVNGVLFGFFYGDHCYTSSDGSTWTLRTLPSTQSWRDVAWTGTKYVVVGTASNACAVSVDAQSWVAGGSIGAGGAYSIAYGAGKLVVAYSTNFSYSSDHGATWTTSTFPTMTATGSYDNIVWTGTKFIVSSNGSGAIAYATSTTGDGYWPEVANTAVGGQVGDSTLHGQGGNLISDGNGTVVMMNYSYRFMSANHGTTWLCFNRFVASLQSKLAGNTTKAVQVINGTNRVALLERAGDSLAFTSRYATVPTLASLQYVAYSGTAWIVCNNSGAEVVRSTDGINWALVTANFAGTAYADRTQILAAASNCFISLSGKRSLDDGLTWGTIVMPASITSITAKGTVFVATTGTATYHTSSDNGTTWTQRTAPAALGDIFDGNYWMIPVADTSSPTGAYLHATSDGINWVTRAAPADINVAYFNSASAVTGILGQCLILSNRQVYPTLSVMTKDGGATWHFDRSAYPEGSGNVQTLWGGYEVSGWTSLNTNFCGMAYRQNLTPLSSNGDCGSSPTYYQRVA